MKMIISDATKGDATLPFLEVHRDSRVARTGMFPNVGALCLMDWCLHPPNDSCASPKEVNHLVAGQIWWLILQGHQRLPHERQSGTPTTFNDVEKDLDSPIPLSLTANNLGVGAQARRTAFHFISARQ